MMLDTKNHLLGEEMIFKGTVNSSLVSPREIFLSAVSYHAVGILLIHNHPSGDPSPSEADLDFTQRIKDAGELYWNPSFGSYYYWGLQISEFSSGGDFLADRKSVC